MRRVVVPLAALVLAACAPGVREAQPFAGVWTSDGFGIYLDVHGGDVDLYEYSRAHCALVYGGGARGISTVLGFEGGILVLTDAGRVIHLDALEALPAACAEEYRSTDPGRIVAVTAATMEELYRPALDDQWEDRLASVTEGLAFDAQSAATTFRALTALLAPLDDPGVRLAVDDPTLWNGVWSAGAGPFAGREPYLPPGLEASTVGGDDGIVVGRFGSVGYLGLSRLGGFAEDDEGSQRVLAAELDSLLAESASLILDLRGASSGRAVEAMLIASRFVSEELLVGTQMIGATPAGAVTVRPTVSAPFVGRVAVLVGPGSAGAAEMLVLALRGLPAVTVVGEPTAGSPTPPLARYLPNGWSLGVPALDLVTPDGRAWSGTPILPGIEAATAADDLDGGSDPALELALDLLG